MCGLVGVLLYPGGRTAQERKRVADAFTEDLLSNEERGRDAAGVAMIGRDGGYELLKKPGSVSSLVGMPGYQRMMSRLDRDTVCMLGHTRLPTRGNPGNNLNNHPLVAGHIVAVHNGTIVNDNQIFADYGFDRLGDVDSEALLWLLNSISPFRRSEEYVALVRSAMETVRGTLALMAVDLRRPTSLVVVRDTMPLCLHYEESLRALFLSSRYVTLRKMFGDSVRHEHVQRKMVSYFDARHLVRLGGRPTCVGKLDIGDGQSPHRPKQRAKAVYSRSVQPSTGDTG